MVGRRFLSRARARLMHQAHRRSRSINLGTARITSPEATEIRNEMRVLKRRFNSEIGALETKMDDGFKSLESSFATFKSNSESAASSAERSWYWYQVGCFGFATILLGRDFIIPFGVSNAWPRSPWRTFID